MKKRKDVRQAGPLPDGCVPADLCSGDAGAVLFVNYDPVPLFGHASLFYRDGEGLWHITQFESGRADVLSGVSAAVVAAVLCFAVLPRVVPGGIFWAFPLFVLTAGHAPAAVTDRVIGGPADVWRRMAIRKRFDYLVLEGDYSAVGGNVPRLLGRRWYHLFFRNCTHYTEKLLRTSGPERIRNSVRHRLTPKILLRDLREKENAGNISPDVDLNEKM